LTLINREGSMQFGNRGGSSNVRDKRGMGGMAVGGGLGAVVLTILAVMFGVDPSVITQQGGQTGAPSTTAPADDAHFQFVSKVLKTTEDVWQSVFQEQVGKDYQAPVLNVFSGSVPSACGYAQAATGPFYCPSDQQVYIDLSFYDELQNRLGAGGDFAQAYVVAHEVGHHVQKLLGISDQVQQQGGDQQGANGLSVRVELQADCFAGIWANRVKNLPEIVIEPGDVEEALNAASAIGDDRLQKQSQGEVVPESFTHGTSQQRVHWFQQGYDSGKLDRCDTFAARSL
jgi:predicted metalloprotease